MPAKPEIARAYKALRELYKGLGICEEEFDYHSGKPMSVYAREYASQDMSINGMYEGLPLREARNVEVAVETQDGYYLLELWREYTQAGEGFIQAHADGPRVGEVKFYGSESRRRGKTRVMGEGVPPAAIRWGVEELGHAVNPLYLLNINRSQDIQMPIRLSKVYYKTWSQRWTRKMIYRPPTRFLLPDTPRSDNGVIVAYGWTNEKPAGFDEWCKDSPAMIDSTIYTNIEPLIEGIYL
jgi:hypothetical protein